MVPRLDAGEYLLPPWFHSIFYHRSVACLFVLLLVNIGQTSMLYIPFLNKFEKTNKLLGLLSLPVWFLQQPTAMFTHFSFLTDHHGRDNHTTTTTTNDDDDSLTYQTSSYRRTDPIHPFGGCRDRRRSKFLQPPPPPSTLRQRYRINFRSFNRTVSAQSKTES